MSDSIRRSITAREAFIRSRAPRGNLHVGALEDDEVELFERQMLAVDLNCSFARILSLAPRSLFGRGSTSGLERSSLGGKILAVFIRQRFGAAAAIADDVQRFAGRDQFAGRWLTNLVSEPDGPALRFRHARADGEHDRRIAPGACSGSTLRQRR